MFSGSHVEYTPIEKLNREYIFRQSLTEENRIKANIYYITFRNSALTEN